MNYFVRLEKGKRFINYLSPIEGFWTLKFFNKFRVVPYKTNRILIITKAKMES